MHIGNDEAWALAWNALNTGKLRNARLSWPLLKTVAPLRKVTLSMPDFYSLHADAPFNWKVRMLVSGRA